MRANRKKEACPRESSVQADALITLALRELNPETLKELFGETVTMESLSQRPIRKTTKQERERLKKTEQMMRQEER